MEKHIELGGKAYVVDFNTNAACEAEERMGIGIDKMFEKAMSGARMGLWMGLITNAPKTTLRDVGKIIDEHCANGGTITDIVNICMEGMKEAGFFGPAAAKAKPQT